MAELAWEIAMHWIPTSDSAAIARTKFVKCELRSEVYEQEEKRRIANSVMKAVM